MILDYLRLRVLRLLICGITSSDVYICMAGSLSTSAAQWGEWRLVCRCYLLVKFLCVSITAPPLKWLPTVLSVLARCVLCGCLGLKSTVGWLVLGSRLLRTMFVPAQL